MSNNQLNNRLKTLRSQHNLTQAELASKVNVTRKTINTVENNVFVPSTLLALKLAQVLNASVEDIFFLSE